MPKGTSIDEVDEAVAAVKIMQEQIKGLVKALTLIAARVEAIEKNASSPARHV